MARSQVDSSPGTGDVFSDNLATHLSQTAVTVVRVTPREPTLLPQSTTAQGYLTLHLDTARVDGNIGFLVITDNGSTRPRAVFYGDFRQITPQL